MRPVFIDFETQSGANLRQVGGRRYASHPSTKVLCLCASWDDPAGNPVSCAWVPDNIGLRLPSHTEDGVEIHRGPVPPTELLAAVDRIGVVSAHNASSFDRHIWGYLVRHPVRRWIDTIHLARSNGLPAGLDKLGNWFTGSGKDPGSAMMKKLMMLEWDNDDKVWTNKYTLPGAVATIVRYCVRDVDLLRMVYDKVSSTDACDVGGIEIDQRINDFGVKFDEALAAKIATVSTKVVTLAGKEIEKLSAEIGKPLTTKQLTSIPAMHKWLESTGVKLANMRRKTVEAFIANPDAYLSGSSDDNDVPEQDATEDDEGLNLTPNTIRILRLRNSFLRVTGAKLERASASAIRGRLFDLFVYWGAHTGRWSSRIVQVHNLPRGNKKLNLPLLCRQCDFDTVIAESERLHILPDDVLSALVRPTLIPTEGMEFVIGDFSSIEARVLGWMAGEQKILDTFIAGRDLYKDMASQMYGVEYDQVTDLQRDAGKVGVLGSGYGMGPGKLSDFAAGLGIDLAANGLDPKWITNQYRNTYPKIAGEYAGILETESGPITIRSGGLWKDVQRAFEEVTLGNLGIAHAGKCSFTREGLTTIITLPSGRRLSYRKARMEPQTDRWGRSKLGLVYSSGRGDVRTYGGKLVENIDQAISRDVHRDKMIQVWNELKLPIPLDIHDEIVAETLKGTGPATLETMLRTMSMSPEWAPDLPLAAEGHVAPRYTKTKWVE